MVAKELEQNEARASQAASIIGQLEILSRACGEDGNVIGKIGNICCQIAVASLALLITEYRPPRRWNSITKEKVDE